MAEPARTARRGAMPSDLAPDLTEALRRAGIEALYSHQLRAWETAPRSDLIVTSGTASGKSLAFNLPVLDAIARAPKARALYLYPTKALAQDQARKLALLRPPNLRHAIYDGDTPREERPAIRRKSNLILTNPDMLHVGVLPNHRQWGDFLANLEFVVVDEAHTYRGVFGSHVANVLRRLRRGAGAPRSVGRRALPPAHPAPPPAASAGRAGGRGAGGRGGFETGRGSTGGRGRGARRSRRRRTCWPSWSARACGR